MTDDVVRRAARDAVDKRGRRLMVALFGVSLLGVVGLLVAFFDSRDTAESQQSAIEALEVRADASTAAAQQLADQVRSLGGVPAVQLPAPERGDTGVGIASVDPGPCSITVRLTDGRASTADGLCGRPGERGEHGRSVVSAAANGCDVVLAWSDATTQRVGPFCGPPGTPGVNGADGQTPPCMAEPSQCRGADGPEGKPGDPGADGAPPRGWVTTRADGSEEACTRDTGSPDSDPTYSCETTSPPTLLPKGKQRIGG